MNPSRPLFIASRLPRPRTFASPSALPPPALFTSNHLHHHHQPHSLGDNYFISHRPTLPAAVGRRTLSTATTADTQMRILLVGSPGSGKGTQSSRLVGQYDVSVITAGDVLRSHIRRGTEIGKRADQVIKQGGLMPDDVMMDLIGSEVEAMGERHWILDGFPRTRGQAAMLDTLLERQGRPLRAIVNLDVPEDVILDRILNRWTHLASGRVYNLDFNPPKVAGKDDVTGEPLQKREDDNVETFGKRLASFHAATAPMLEHYRAKAERSTGVLDIDAKSTPPSEATLGKGEELFINLRGDESRQIWPHLLQIVTRRFPNLAPAAAAAAAK